YVARARSCGDEKILKRDPVASPSAPHSRPGRRHARRAQSRAGLSKAFRRHLSRSRPAIWRGALSLLPRRRRRRSEAESEGWNAPDERRRRGDRRRDHARGGGADRQSEALARETYKYLPATD